MERRHSGVPPREDVYEADVMGSNAAQPGKVAGAGVVSWGCYSGGAAVDALIGYLNPVGLRESALKRVCPILLLSNQFGCAASDLYVCLNFVLELGSC